MAGAVGVEGDGVGMSKQRAVTLGFHGKKVVLVGNPNCGKSVVFNALTGMYVDVSNFPGTTVELANAPFGDDTIIDTPGVYGISGFNDEERVTRDVVVEADVIINVVNALHLERDLFLTVQISDLGIPMVIALNMMDEAQRNGLDIDTTELSRRLGVPVIPTVAIKGEGLSELQEALPNARVGVSRPPLQARLEAIHGCVPNRRQALLYLEDDADTIAALRLPSAEQREAIYQERRQFVNDLIEQTVCETREGVSLRTRIGQLMLAPLTGVPLLLLTLWGMYRVLGVLVADRVVGFTEGVIMAEHYEPFIYSIVTKFIDSASPLGTILVGEFGILTMAMTYIFGLLLPLVIAFYLLLAILEDSGYLPRIAVLVDKSLTKIGLNGRAIIPMILGFGCVTMAAITTRLLGSKRERMIAIALLAITIPCSAQIGVITGMIAPLGLRYTAIYFFVMVTTFVLVGTLLNKFLPGKSTDLLIDLPPVRWPQFGNVIKKTLNKSHMFLLEAAPLFVLGALLISIMQLTGALTVVQDVFSPLTVSWLRLPKEAANAFIMGIIRRDFGAAGLAQLALSPEQTLVAMITITLFVPCIAAVLVIFKERNWKESLTLWLSSFFIAFFVGGLIAQFVI